jgi:extracellular solute-binding protein
MPYLMKYDILGMAKHGVLKIDPRIIHSADKNIVAVTSSITVIPYNKTLISEDKVPTKWEDFLRPEFTGKEIRLGCSALAGGRIGAGLGYGKNVGFCPEVSLPTAGVG